MDRSSDDLMVSVSVPVVSGKPLFLDHRENRNCMPSPASSSISSPFLLDISFVLAHASHRPWVGKDYQVFGKACGETRDSVWVRL
jgi:hypothetical protein